MPNSVPVIGVQEEQKMLAISLQMATTRKEPSAVRRLLFKLEFRVPK